MIRRLSWQSLATALVALAARAAAGAERFPPPDFTDHKLPTLVVPPVSSAAWEWIDVTFLTAALVTASYLALVRRSRKGLFVLGLASLVWLGFVRNGCICPIGAIQNVTLAVSDASYVLPASVVLIFVLPILFTLFFGRTFCAAVCPLGAVQELAAVRTLRVPRWVDQALGLVAYFYLGLAVLLAATGTGFVICRYDPFVAFFRRSGSIEMLVYGGSLLAIGVFIGRPYCRYLCPLGAILRVCSRFTRHHLRIPPEECTNCRLCEDACPYGAIRKPCTDSTPVALAPARRRLLLALVGAPVLIAAGFWLGPAMTGGLARLHPDIRLAEQLQAEEQGQAEPTDASDAFRRTGRAAADLYQDAQRATERLRWGAAWLGAWIGLVLAVKFVDLALVRRRREYEPDRSGCVSCGRCFWHCPAEQARLGLIAPPVELPSASASLPVAPQHPAAAPPPRTPTPV